MVLGCKFVHQSLFLAPRYLRICHHQPYHPPVYKGGHLNQHPMTQQQSLMTHKRRVYAMSW
ncbi:hypothetical protein HanXRQr2_Chr16g0761981 [Helianthus annuus]|uniref:Uncharacterized protein n=1 Tax=Helianthus annuus TaxID=4232 RepID=A0A9K3DTK6_HELAN|nr:hypothetical protein HanXRQr2_Chr16g0761981 [Helianthus annuus]KAJ0822277.1 hypothetical protein HanPSC8_Chr16g0730121 [Helianthus annuus]